MRKICHEPVDEAGGKKKIPANLKKAVPTGNVTRIFLILVAHLLVTGPESIGP